MRGTTAALRSWLLTSGLTPSFVFVIVNLFHARHVRELHKIHYLGDRPQHMTSEATNLLHIPDMTRRDGNGAKSCAQGPSCKATNSIVLNSFLQAVAIKIPFERRKQGAIAL